MIKNFLEWIGLKEKIGELEENEVEKIKYKYIELHSPKHRPPAISDRSRG